MVAKDRNNYNWQSANDVVDMLKKSGKPMSIADIRHRFLMSYGVRHNPTAIRAMISLKRLQGVSIVTEKRGHYGYYYLGGNGC